MVIYHYYQHEIDLVQAHDYLITNKCIKHKRSLLRSFVASEWYYVYNKISFYAFTRNQQQKCYFTSTITWTLWDLDIQNCIITYGFSESAVKALVLLQSWCTWLNPKIRRLLLIVLGIGDSLVKMYDLMLKQTKKKQKNKKNRFTFQERKSNKSNSGLLLFRMHLKL